MTPKFDAIERQSFRKRFAFPLSIVFGCWATSTLIYNNAWRFLDPQFHRPLAVVCVILMGASIIFGPAWIYPVAFFRGASLRERVVACLITPFAWILKELVMMPSSYSIGEKMYNLFNPLFLGTISLAVIEMGICEIACRWAAHKRSAVPARRVFSAGPIAAVLAGLCAVYFFNLWGDRVGFWYIHQSIYQYLFMK
ncbi:MAG: hypothetical protein JW793_11920 [Acidobacteria bacterium]|nr:hypothetical protein [Acidobacteriota bacterium]